MLICTVLVVRLILTYNFVVDYVAHFVFVRNTETLTCLPFPI